MATSLHLLVPNTSSKYPLFGEISSRLFKPETKLFPFLPQNPLKLPSFGFPHHHRISLQQHPCPGRKIKHFSCLSQDCTSQWPKRTWLYNLGMCCNDTFTHFQLAVGLRQYSTIQLKHFPLGHTAVSCNWDIPLATKQSSDLLVYTASSLLTVIFKTLKAGVSWQLCLLSQHMLIFTLMKESQLY